MTAANHTEHYGLSQYTEDDRPTYTGDYNGDMTKIDAAIYAASQAGGMTKVEHTADLTGDGTDSSPLGVADAIARTESVTQAITSAIVDRLTAGDIRAGDGINIETSGNQVTISYVGGSSGGLSAVTHDATLMGDGTGGNPLGMIDGNFTNAISLSGSEADANKLTANRIYKIDRHWENMPPNLTIVGGSLLDASLANTHIQCILAYTDGKGASIFVRQGWASLAGAKWDRLVKESEYNVLVNRVATLESRVATLTAAAAPGTTGLTATQLDTQYSDDYNIVRAGTPIRSNESEDSSQ